MRVQGQEPVGGLEGGMLALTMEGRGMVDGVEYEDFDRYTKFGVLSECESVIACNVPFGMCPLAEYAAICSSTLFQALLFHTWTRCEI